MEVADAVPLPSLLCDLLLERIYGPRHVLGGWSSDLVLCPTDFDPSRYFEEHKRQDVPPVLFMNLEHLQERLNRPVLRQWAHEWERVRMRAHAPYSDYPYYFGDAALARSGFHPQVITRQSEVYRSAYERTLAFAVDQWGLSLAHAAYLLTDVLPVLPGLFEVEPQPAPALLQDLGTAAGKNDGDIEQLARAALDRAASDTLQLVSLTMPTALEVAEFGEIQLRAYLVTDDFDPDPAPRPWIAPQLLVESEGLAFRGDLPDIDLLRISERGRTGTAIPVVFDAIPMLHGTWHDDYLAAGIAVPAPYCIDVPGAVLDADANGCFVVAREARLSETQFWHDHWTSIGSPNSGTRCGVLCRMDGQMLMRCAKAMKRSLAWRVEVSYWSSDRGYGELTPKRTFSFFRP